LNGLAVLSSADTQEQAVADEKTQAVDVQGAEATSENRGRTLTGTVVSDKNDKTVTVQVTRQLQHPRYKKYIKKTKKYHAHDEQNEAHEGDLVTIIESRPISRLKRWRLVEILKRAV
jgi:small subunit ribosomal protein S17